MMAPLKINGAGNPISIAMGRYVTAKVKALDEPGIHLQMHPLQFGKVANMVNGIDFVGTRAEAMFCGLQIVEDPNMRDDEIQWRDKQGGLVAKITGLAT